MGREVGFDYDRGDIHRTYASGRALSPAQFAVWEELVREALGGDSVRRVVDLGCGLGRFSAWLSGLTDAAVAGVDRSERMLAQAMADPAERTVHWIRASAEKLPIRDASCDFVWMFLVYHHLVDRPACLAECARILGRGRTLVIVNSTAETLDSYLWLPFFPSARAIDLARLPRRASVIELARDAGLGLVCHRTVMNPVAPDLPTYAERIASRTISTLQMVSDEEWAHGIAGFRRYCQREDRGQPVLDEIDAFTFRRVT